MKFKITLTITIIFLINFNAVANDYISIKEVTPFLSDENLEELLNNKELVKFYNTSFSPEYNPETDIKSYTEELYKKNDVNLGMEALIFEPYDFSNKPIDTVLLKSFNVINSISTLKGIQYWDVDKEKFKTLYKDATIVKSPENLDRVKDRTFKALPNSETFYAFLNDNTFGKGVNTVNITHSKDSLNLNISNSNDIKLLFVTIIKQDTININITVIPTDEGLLFYGIASAKTINLNLLKNKATDSMYSRVIAIKNWFVDQYKNNQMLSVALKN